MTSRNGHRRRLSAYLALVRPPNITTALADVLAGYGVAGLGNAARFPGCWSPRRASMAAASSSMISSIAGSTRSNVRSGRSRADACRPRSPDRSEVCCWWRASRRPARASGAAATDRARDRLPRGDLRRLGQTSPGHRSGDDRELSRAQPAAGRRREPAMLATAWPVAAAALRVHRRGSRRSAAAKSMAAAARWRRFR